MAKEEDELVRLKTPSTSHLDFANIYEPSEDTFVLVDALENDGRWLQNRSPRIAVEVGTGSGCVLTFVAKLLARGYRHRMHCVGVDLNPLAARAAKLTASENGVKQYVDTAIGSLFDSLRPHSVDLALFNPPYVPTTDEELARARRAAGNVDDPHLIDLAWAGGIDGRRVLDAFLAQLDDALSPSGTLYLVVLQQNRLDDVVERLRAMHLHTCVVLKRRACREMLYIVRAHR
jgi:release factor glutamine methyltransferase